MRIAIDARLWTEPRSGIGRYTRALTEQLLRLAPEEHWILYVDRAPGPALRGAEVRCLPWPQRLLWSLWHAPRDLRRHPVDVFHGVTGFELPGKGPWRLVTTVHDLVPFRLPTLVPARHRWAVRCLLGGALRRTPGHRGVGDDARRAACAAIACRPSGWSSCLRRPRPTSSRPLRRRSPRPAPATGSPARTCCSWGFSSRRRTSACCWRPSRRFAAPGRGGHRVDRRGRARLGPDPVQRATTLGLDGAVRFVGAVADAELPALYGGARLRVPLAVGGLRAAGARGDGRRRARRRLEPGRPP